MIGSVAGGPHNDGYRQIRVGSIRYLEHRIVWIHQNGDIPEGMEIDHIDHVRDNNRIENLRMVYPIENSRNRTKYDNARILPTGVHQYCPTGYRVIVGGAKGRITKGKFKTPQAASRAYRKLIATCGYHENHSK